MDTARDSTGKTGRTRGQRYCLQLISGRSLDQIMLDFVIHEFIARRRRIEELARGRSNMEGEVLKPRHRKRARMRRQHPSPRPVCYYVKIQVVICLFNPRYWWAESVCMCVRKRFKRVVLLVQNEQTNEQKRRKYHTFYQHDQAHAHHRFRQRDTIGLPPIDADIRYVCNREERNRA